MSEQPPEPHFVAEEYGLFTEAETKAGEGGISSWLITHLYMDSPHNPFFQFQD